MGSNDHDEDDDGEFNPGEDDTNAERSSNSSDTNCDGESSSEGNHGKIKFLCSCWNYEINELNSYELLCLLFQMMQTLTWKNI